MASGFSFSDPVRRQVTEAAMAAEEYSTEFLVPPFTEGRDFEADSLIISDTVNYEVMLPADLQTGFRTWGVEGGNGLSRLASERRSTEIQEFPIQIFVTDNEITLGRKRGWGPLKRRAVRQLGGMIQRFRIVRYFDSLYLAVDENEELGGDPYPSMVLGDSSAQLTDYDLTHEAVRKFAGNRKGLLAGWHVHSDWYTVLETEADRLAQPGELKYIRRGAGGEVLLHNIPVMEGPWEDATVMKNYEEYTQRGLSYVDETDPENPITVYRTYLVLRNSNKEYKGFSPTEKQMDTAPIPAGTAGWPENGMSSGMTWFLSYIHANAWELPYDGLDRLGVVEILHGAYVP